MIRSGGVPSRPSEPALPLFSSDSLLRRARAILGRERRRLRGMTRGELVLTGGSSIPGAVTRGDIDLHLRVDPAEFESVIRQLSTVYDVVHPDIWSRTLATFAVAGEDTGIAVTPIDSEHDRRCTKAWRRLRAEPGVLDAYNRMKLEHATSDERTYLAAKGRFFERLADGAVDTV